MKIYDYNGKKNISGNRIREVRLRRRLTQEELAEKMGVSRQTISKWEMNTAFPEMDKAIALCGLFSVTLDELVRGKLDSGNEAYERLGKRQRDTAAEADRLGLPVRIPGTDQRVSYARICGRLHSSE